MSVPLGTFIPAIAPIAMATSTASAAAKSMIGEEKYENTRSGVITFWSAMQGFLPFNMLLLPFQIALMVILTLILVYVFGFTLKNSLLLGWLATGFIIMSIAGKVMDVGTRVIFGAGDLY